VAVHEPQQLAAAQPVPEEDIPMKHLTMAVAVTLALCAWGTPQASAQSASAMSTAAAYYNQAAFAAQSAANNCTSYNANYVNASTAAQYFNKAQNHANKSAYYFGIGDLAAGQSQAELAYDASFYAQQCLGLVKGNSLVNYWTKVAEGFGQDGDDEYPH
jgi:hypothetical protein